MRMTCRSALALCMLSLSGAACSNDDDGQAEQSDRTPAVGGDVGDSIDGSGQTPPMGREALEAWLAKGAYLNWRCESKPHAFRAPSPHGFNRICSNDLIAEQAQSTTDWPQGAAAVKELYAAADDAEPVGYAVYLKTADESDGGANWYWYERVPLDHPAPHDAQGVVADGMGSAGPAKAICVSCHAAAGADPDHTPSEGGRDQVYTPVR